MPECRSFEKGKVKRLSIVGDRFRYKKNKPMADNSTIGLFRFGSTSRSAVSYSDGMDWLNIVLCNMGITHG